MSLPVGMDSRSVLRMCAPQRLIRSKRMKHIFTGVGQCIRCFQRRKMPDALQHLKPRLRKKAGESVPERSLMLDLISVAYDHGDGEPYGVEPAVTS